MWRKRDAFLAAACMLLLTGQSAQSPAVPMSQRALIGSLARMNVPDRRLALLQLDSSGVADPGSLEALTSILADSDLVSAMRAAMILRDSGERGHEQLRRTLLDGPPRARALCAEALSAELSRRFRMERLEMSDQSFRFRSQMSPRTTRRSAPLFIPGGLMKALRDEDPEVRRAAAQALGTHGSDATIALGPLCRLMGDPVPYVQVTAGLAVRRISGFSIDPLVRSLIDPSAAVRRGALLTLGALYSDAAEAAKEIDQMRGDRNTSVSDAALLASSRVRRTIIAVGRTDPPKAPSGWLRPTVELRLVVNEQGRVEDVRVVGGVDHATNMKAMTHALTWRFSPAKLDGKTVAVFVTTGEIR
jgi:hypothetical protein